MCYVPNSSAIVFVQLSSGNDKSIPSALAEKKNACSNLNVDWLVATNFRETLELFHTLSWQKWKFCLEDTTLSVICLLDLTPPTSGDFSYYHLCNVDSLLNYQRYMLRNVSVALPRDFLCLERKRMEKQMTVLVHSFTVPLMDKCLD